MKKINSVLDCNPDLTIYTKYVFEYLEKPTLIVNRGIRGLLSNRE